MQKQIVVVLSILILILLNSCSKGIKISLENQTGNIIKNIKIYYSGGIKNVAKIENNSRWEGFINPNSESHIEIDYIDFKNIKHHKKIDCYFENRYNGKLNIKINKNGKILVTSNNINMKY